MPDVYHWSVPWGTLVGPFLVTVAAEWGLYLLRTFSGRFR